MLITHRSIVHGKPVITRVPWWLLVPAVLFKLIYATGWISEPLRVRFADWVADHSILYYDGKKLGPLWKELEKAEARLAAARQEQPRERPGA
jgi:hypothetical protein